MTQVSAPISSLEYIRQTARKFLNRNTSAGLLLILTTVVALIIGNSAWADAYHHLLEDEITFELLGDYSFGLTVEKWINDGLMVIFFLVAGLELKKEILVGDLSTVRKATMPLMGAVGGMLVPALIFVGLNMGEKSIDGWGIPMGTDIAYSLGIISLLGKRVPPQLKTLLIALAIADDLGAILVIAFFYTSEIYWSYLALAGGTFAGLLLLNYFGVKRLYFFVLGGILLWFFFLNSGIHATIAGVLFALTIPVKPKLDSKLLKERTARNLEKLSEAKLDSEDPLQNKEQRGIIADIKRDTRNSRPPLLRLENRLVDFNSFFIIPIFALANAAVHLDVPLDEVFSAPLGLGIALGLVVGKLFGITFFSWLGQKLGIADLPPFVSWRHIIGMGCIAGIGFTMSLFITSLAFSDPEMIKIAKISILIASGTAIVLGMGVLGLVKK